MAYLTRAVRAQAGVVISASHNPYHDNGIKFFSEGGVKLPDSVELAIEAELERPMGCADSASLGKARRLDDAAGRYIEFCKASVPYDLDLHGMRIVVDCANGAAYHIAPHVFHELGAEVVSIGNTPTGRNINEGVGATYPKALADAVRAHRADIGIALDGDADRVVMADASGRTYDGDELLYLIVKERQAAGKVPGVVGTLMTNLAFEQAMQRLGIPFARAKVGDRYILEMLHEKRWLHGGENSGHILCLDCHTTGDGIVSALQVLKALRASDQTLAEAGRELQLYPQVLCNVNLADRDAWQSNQALASAVSSAEHRLAGRGRVLLRASGTEALLRVMVEGEDGTLVRQLAEEIAAVAGA